LSEIFAVVIALSAIFAVVTWFAEIFALVIALSSICAVAIVPPKVFNAISFKLVPSE